MNTAYLTHAEYLRGLYTANNLTVIEKELMNRLIRAIDEKHELQSILERNGMDYVSQ